MAWSEATLEYLHELSCEDPLTGLASLAHVRTRLAEIYREAELTDVGVARSHALVVVELPLARRRRRCRGHHFTRALRLVPGGRGARARCSPAARPSAGWAWTGPSPWSPAPPTSAPSVGAAARTSSRTSTSATADVRVWIEGLPAAADSAARLLDELAR